MPKYIITLLLALGVIDCKAQTFSYSDNHINNPENVYIIGQVKNNIIAWYKDSNNYKRSVILVYDLNLRLKKKVITDILYSNATPSPGFSATMDSFYVAYPYKKGNTWDYRLSGFDDNGHLSSTYIIDTLRNLSPDESVTYKYYQSADKQTIGCLKTSINKKYNAVKFECTFLQHGSLYRDQFVIAVDFAHEKIADVVIDSNKNITLLKTSYTDSGFSISIIKKEFSANNYLVATKKLAIGDIRDGTARISVKRDGYTAYGVWENAPGDLLAEKQQYETGIYTWTADEKLSDMPGENILHSDSAKIFACTLFIDQSANNTLHDFFAVQTDIINFRDSRTSLPVFWGYSGDQTNPTIAVFKYDTLRYRKALHYTAGFSIMSVNNNNKVEWQNALNSDRDKIFLTDPFNNKVVAGKKGIHIIRSIAETKTANTIEHVLITYSGKYEKLKTIVWRSKYHYLVSDAVETNDGALIIPCLKNNRMIFAKMVL